MKRSAIMVLIVFLIILFLGIFYFINLEEQVEYKTFQTEGLSFKYPADWRDYAADINETGIVVAMGDPETVGFQNMSIPTTMILIQKTTMPLNNSQYGLENNLSETMISGNVNFMQMLEANANQSSALFWDTLKSSIINVINGDMDVPTMINDVLISFLNAYSSYSGIDYDVKNITIEGINAQEFTFQGTNGYSPEKEYSRIITFETRNDTAVVLYVIMCSARGQDMESASEQFDIIIESLKIS